MRSSYAFNILVAISGLSTIVSATKPLATISPCPSCPKNIKPAAVVVTDQYQPVPTCSPVQKCESKKCSSTVSCSTYDWVSTVIPCLGGASTTTITKTDQVVKLSHVSTVLTSHLPCATTTPAPHWNSTLPKYKNETCTLTELQTMVVDISAPYNECGPLAMGKWGGSGLCKTCVPSKNETDQVVHISKCVDKKCSTYKETWVSRKATSRPTQSSSPYTAPYTTHATCTQSGLNTIPIVATISPPSSVGDEGEDGTPAQSAYTTTFTIITSVDKPQEIDISTTITITDDPDPLTIPIKSEPSVISSESIASITTAKYAPSNGPYTIPITTVLTPSEPEFTKPVTTTVLYTTTVTDGPKVIQLSRLAHVVLILSSISIARRQLLSPSVRPSRMS